MTAVTPQQQRLTTASKTIAAKLQAFRDGLTPDEQTALGIALRRFDAQPEDAAEDTAGFSSAALLGLAGTRVLLLLTGLETFPPFQPREPSPGPQP
jgi:hypothetical protein